jgi:hypothetical protein
MPLTTQQHAELDRLYDNQQAAKKATPFNWQELIQFLMQLLAIFFPTPTPPPPGPTGPAKP